MTTIASQFCNLATPQKLMMLLSPVFFIVHIIATLLVSTRNPSCQVEAFIVVSTRPSINGIERHHTVCSVRCTHRSTIFQLWDTKGNDNKNDDNDNEESSNDQIDIESARQQLESLLSMTTKDDDNNTSDDDDKPFSVREFLKSLPSPPSNELDSIKLPLPPPITTMERRRRESEILLLQQLTDSDDATSRLWDLWYSERGKHGKRKLSETDSLMGNPQRWDECEALLVQLIDGNHQQHQVGPDEGENENDGDDFDRRPGIYFVEAVNRLATLYFLQQKLEDSYKLCRVVLQLKPWHFGALSGIVQVCIGLGDRDEARAWAERRLPSIVAGGSFPGAPINAESAPHNPRRAEWCDKAVANAKDLLVLAETNTQQSLGRPENYYLDKAKESSRGETRDDKGSEVDDAWQ